MKVAVVVVAAAAAAAADLTQINLAGRLACMFAALPAVLIVQTVGVNYINKHSVCLSAFDPGELPSQTDNRQTDSGCRLIGASDGNLLTFDLSSAALQGGST